MTDTNESVDKAAVAASDAATAAEAKTAYFYYMRQNGQNYDVEAYEYFDIRNGLPPVDDLVTHLVDNAVSQGKDPRCYATNMDDLLRRRKSLLIIAVEDQHFPTDDPLEFIGQGNNNGRHTFEFIANFSRTIGGGRSAGVTVYYNKIKKHTGSWGKHEPEEYRLRFNAQSNIAAAASVYDDSGGTNMGPPPPPPLIGFPPGGGKGR